jgi:hypothetical protein
MAYTKPMRCGRVWRINIVGSISATRQTSAGKKWQVQSIQTLFDACERVGGREGKRGMIVVGVGNGMGQECTRRVYIVDG